MIDDPCAVRSAHVVPLVVRVVVSCNTIISVYDADTKGLCISIITIPVATVAGMPRNTAETLPACRCNTACNSETWQQREASRPPPPRPADCLPAESPRRGSRRPLFFAIYLKRCEAASTLGAHFRPHCTPSRDM